MSDRILELYDEMMEQKEARIRELEAELQACKKNRRYCKDEAAARIREQRDLLDECEQAVKAIIDDQTIGGGDDTYPIAKTLLAKLRGQEKADE